MTPSDAERLDQLIDTARPQLRQLLAAVLGMGTSFGAMEIAQVPLPSGERWAILLCVMNEPYARLINGCVAGMQGSLESYGKLQPAPAKAFDVPL